MLCFYLHSIQFLVASTSKGTKKKRNVFVSDSETDLSHSNCKFKSLYICNVISLPLTFIHF